uniref:Uncharacterized protein n=1 Tax=Romanomermis culicivorax TaxID=13658 RepID=A0A915KAI3_ROMCU
MYIILESWKRIANLSRWEIGDPCSMFSQCYMCMTPQKVLAAVIFVILPKFRDEKQAALKARRVLSPQGMFSDHFVFLRAYDQWLNAYNRGNERQFCSQNFVSSACLNMIYGIRKEVLEVSPYSTLLNGKRCSKSKCAELMPTNWLIYNDLVRIKSATAVTSVTVALMAGNTYLTRSDAIKIVEPSSIFESWDDDFNGNGKGFGPVAYHVLEIDEISFKIEKDIANKIMCLREKIMSMFIRLLHSPWVELNQSDEAALEAVSEVLRNEDKQYGLDFVDTDNLNCTT